MTAREAWQRAIFGMSQELIATLDPDTVLQKLVEVIRQLDGVWASAVFEYDEGLSCLRVLVSSGLREEYARSTIIPVGSLAVGRAFQDRDLVVVTDVHADRQFSRLLRSLHRQKLDAILAAPLIARNKLLGILAVYFHLPLSQDDYDEGSIRTFANLAALAIDNARLFHAQLQANRSLELANQQLSVQSEVLNRSLSIHDWLVRTVLSQNGIDAVVRALGELAQSTVVVEDQYLNVLSVSPRGGDQEHPSEQGDLGLARFVEDARVREHIVKVRSMRRPQLLAAIPEIGLFTARITAPIVVTDILLGFVSILQAGQQSGSLDHVLAEQGAVALALEMMKSKVAFEAEQKVRGDFLQSLLAGDIGDLDGACAAVAGNKINLQALRRVLIVRPDKPAMAKLRENEEHYGGVWQSQTYRVVERLIVGQHPESILIVVKGDLVVLLGGARALSDSVVRELSEQVISSIATYVDGGSASIGIGRSCLHPKELRRSFVEATRALEVATILGKRNAVVRFSDLGILGIILRQNNPDEVREFVTRYIEPLRTYDQKHAGGLVLTLGTYVRNNYRVLETASELSVHPNTVAYRLRKIEELCGISLKDSEDLMNIQLALHLHSLGV